MIASAMPRSRTAAAAAAGAQDFGGFSDIFESVFGEFMGGGARRRARAAAARRRPALRHGDHARGGVPRQDRPRSRSTSRRRATPATARARRPGTRANDLPAVRRPWQGARAAGLLRRRARLPGLPGRGRGDRRSVPRLPRRGRVDKTKTLSVNVPPGVDEGTRIRLAGEGEAGPRGAPAGRPLHLPPRQAAHDLFEREGTTLFARAPISFTTAGARRLAVDPRPRRRHARDQDSRGHPVGQAAPPARRRHARAAGPRPRRPGHPDRGRDPDASSRRARRNCSRCSARPRPATNAPPARASSPS